jgi:hypothetical protein
VVIGHEESSQLDVEPAKYFVLVSKREKRACKTIVFQKVAATFCRNVSPFSPFTTAWN